MDKNEFLGMPVGTANNRLRKMILFDLLCRYGENKCYRCGKEIDKVDNLSIDHKRAWLNVSKDLFWDLDNIAFSHTTCNFGASRHNKKIGEVGTAWCYRCKQFLPVELFGPDKQRWNGLRNICKSCDVRRKKREKNHHTS